MNSIKAKKPAQHRQAIAAAASMQQSALRPPGSSTLQSAPETTTSPKPSLAPLSAGKASMTASMASGAGGRDIVIAADPNDDYEQSKVSKHKRNQFDDDVRMVADLDRWG